MNAAFQQAIDRIQNLSSEEQAELAGILIAEIEDEDRWKTTFAGSGETLSLLVQEAIAEYESGQTKDLDLGP